MISNRPNQRVSISEKMKPDYYMNNMSYYLGVAISNNDKGITQDNIDASNGIVPAKTYNYVTKPLKGDENSNNNLPGDIRNIDFITPIREKNIGEYIELPSEFTVKVDDPNIVIRKNDEVAKIVRPVIEEAIIKEINRLQAESQGQQVDPNQINIKKLADKELEKWSDERANNVLKLVKSINNDNDLESKRLELFNNWWSTEECYIHIYVQNGSIFYEPISPLEGFPIDNGYEFVDDQEAFVIKRRLTIDRIEEYYSDDLTAADRKYIDELIRSANGDGYTVTAGMYEDIYGRKAFDNDNVEQSSNKKLNFSNGRDVSEAILYYKTQVERKILLYVNELGEQQVKVIEDKNFEFNEQLGHLSITKEWITETWKQVLIGDEVSGIYIKPKPVEVQSYDAKGHNKLPIIGKKGILNGIYINPIPKRVISSLALYNIITLQIERQIAKFKGTVEIIPQGMIQGDSAESTKGNMYYRLADNTILYDETQVDFNTVAQGYRLVGNDSASNFIKTLIDYKESIKAEAWDMANMNDGRYGNAAPSSTVTNNQQNIFNAKLGSVLSVTTFNNILTRLYNTIVNYSEYLYPEGISGSVFNNDGSVTYFNLDSGMLTANKYGIYMTNAVLDFQKLKDYKNFAFSAGQNGDFALANAAITGDSISDIRIKVNEYLEMKDEYEKSVQQQEQAQAAKIHEEVLADKQNERLAKREDMITKEDMITDRMIELANINKVDN